MTTVSSYKVARYFSLAGVVADNALELAELLLRTPDVAGALVRELAVAHGPVVLGVVPGLLVRDPLGGVRDVDKVEVRVQLVLLRAPDVQRGAQRAVHELMLGHSKKIKR